MDKKQNAIVTIGVISFIILFLSLTDVVTEDRVFSETENRVLAVRPKFSKEALLEGDYTVDYEAYVTDQFIGRDKWIAVKTVWDILLQKQTINGVYLGEDDYLIEQHKPEDYPSGLVEKKLTLLEKLVKRWDAKVMLVPTADNILTEKLPDNSPFYNQAEFLAEVKERVGGENYIDVYSALKRHSDKEIYYKTDHHWTSQGAYYGYAEWLKSVGEYPLVRSINRREVVTEEFLGTLHSRINLPMEGEVIEYFYDTEENPVTVKYENGRVRDTFYEEKYLDTKNKYGYFLDDNHAFIEIKTSNQNGKTLFVIKDSYANCTIPLLAQHYEKVYVLDLRYFNGKLFQFMQKYEAESDMDVLLLYNCIHFLEDFNYVG